MTIHLDPPAFTLREAARHLKVDRTRLYGMVKEGKINAEVDVCGQLRIPYGELYAAIKEKRK